MRQGLVEKGMYREQENSHLGWPDHSRRKEGRKDQKEKKKGGKGRNKSANLIDDTFMHAHACSVTVLSNSCDPMECSPPGSSVHGLLQARILVWVAVPASRGSS